MSRILSFLLFSILGASVSFAQNLVPNPSFETVTTVPCDPFTVNDFNTSISNWYVPTQGTSDLFSTTIAQSCWNFQPNSTYPGPIGLKGSQLPRTGDVMAGIFLYTIDGFQQREYLQVQLSQPLEPCRQYRISFYVSLADSTEFASSNIMVNLSVGPQTTNNDQVMPLVPHVRASSTISDATNWTLVSGIIEADQAYEFLTIGNFLDDQSTDTLRNPAGPGGPGTYGAYYFVDDVAVERVCPQVNFSGDASFCIGDTFRLNLPVGACFDRFIWSTGDSTSQVLSILDEGFYSVRMWQDTCEFGDTIFVDGLTCPPVLDEANVFSPNGDGINDTYLPMFTQRIDNAEMRIYDRWGNLVYVTDNLNVGWDGKLNGVDCPEGVYFWTITYRGINLEMGARKGSLTLMR
jgi:gliding motility-associated-like protein